MAAHMATDPSRRASNGRDASVGQSLKPVDKALALFIGRYKPFEQKHKKGFNEPAKPGHNNRLNARIGATAHHDISIAKANEPESIACKSAQHGEVNSKHSNDTLFLLFW